MAFFLNDGFGEIVAERKFGKMDVEKRTKEKEGDMCIRLCLEMKCQPKETFVRTISFFFQ